MDRIPDRFIYCSAYTQVSIMAAPLDEFNNKQLLTDDGRTDDGR